MMKRLFMQITVIGLMAAISYGGTTWDYSWSAAGGERLDQYIPAGESQALFTTDYTTTGDPTLPDHSQIVTDSITGQNALRFNNSLTGVKYYSAKGTLAAGSYTDNLRVDFSMRIFNTAVAATTQQQRLLIYRPTKENPGVSDYSRVDLTFARDCFYYRNASGLQTVSLSAGALTGWHDYSLIWDVPTGNAVFTIDGTEYAIESMATTYNSSHIFSLGDTSGNIEGGVSMSYLRFTNNYVPEPATMTLLGLGSLYVLCRRKK